MTVFVPSDPGEQALIESILEEAEIDYLSENSRTQNLFGAGQIGGYNLVVGPVRIQVAKEDAERVRRLIEESLEGSAREALPAELECDPTEDEVIDSHHDPASAMPTTAWSGRSSGWEEWARRSPSCSESVRCA